MAELLFAGVDDAGPLSEIQRSLVDELRRMLEDRGGADALRITTSTEHDPDSGEIVLEMDLTGGDITIGLFVDDEGIAVAMGRGDEWHGDGWSTHWDFAPTWNDVYGEVPDRPWTSLVVDFVAELLDGDVRVRATYRGNRLVKIHSEVIRSDGECLKAGSIGFLTWRLVNPFARRRVDELTVRFRR